VSIPPVPSPSGLNEAGWRKVAQTVLDLLAAVGLEENMEVTKFKDASLYTGDMVINGLQICGEAINHAVDEMSDISESMGLRDLGGAEGSIQRYLFYQFLDFPCLYSAISSHIDI
jgi:uncharacterized protein with HEPN domain